MKSKLLRILRREAARAVKMKTGHIYGCDGKSRVYVVDANGKHRDCFIGIWGNTEREEAYYSLQRLRRAYILDKLQKLK